MEAKASSITSKTKTIKHVTSFSWPFPFNWGQPHWLGQCYTCLWVFLFFFLLTRQNEGINIKSLHNLEVRVICQKNKLVIGVKFG
jgi:hypothetical protein